MKPYFSSYPSSRLYYLFFTFISTTCDSMPQKSFLNESSVIQHELKPAIENLEDNDRGTDNRMTGTALDLTYDRRTNAVLNVTQNNLSLEKKEEESIAQEEITINNKSNLSNISMPRKMPLNTKTNERMTNERMTKLVLNITKNDLSIEKKPAEQRKNQGIFKEKEEKESLDESIALHNNSQLSNFNDRKTNMLLNRLGVSKHLLPMEEEKVENRIENSIENSNTYYAHSNDDRATERILNDTNQRITQFGLGVSQYPLPVEEEKVENSIENSNTYYAQSNDDSVTEMILEMTYNDGAIINKLLIEEETSNNNVYNYKSENNNHSFPKDQLQEFSITNNKKINGLEEFFSNNNVNISGINAVLPSSNLNDSHDPSDPSNTNRKEKENLSDFAASNNSYKKNESSEKMGVSGDNYKNNKHLWLYEGEIDESGIEKNNKSNKSVKDDNKFTKKHKNQGLFQDNQGQDTILEIKTILCNLEREEGNPDLTIGRLYKYLKANLEEVNILINIFDKLNGNILNTLAKLTCLYIESIYTTKTKILFSEKNSQKEQRVLEINSGDWMGIHTDVYQMEQLLLINDRSINFLLLIYTILYILYEQYEKQLGSMQSDIYSNLSNFISCNKEKMESKDTTNPFIYHLNINGYFNKLLKKAAENILNTDNSGKGFLEEDPTKKERLFGSPDNKKIEITLYNPNIFETKIADDISIRFGKRIDYNQVFTYYLCKILYFNKEEEAENAFRDLLSTDIFNVYLKNNAGKSPALGPKDMAMIVPYIITTLKMVYKDKANELDKPYERLINTLLKDENVINNPELLNIVTEIIAMYTEHLGCIFQKYFDIFQIINYDETRMSDPEYVRERTVSQKKMKENTKKYSDVFRKVHNFFKKLSVIYNKKGEIIHRCLNVYSTIKNQQNWYHQETFNSVMKENEFFHIATHDISTIKEDIKNLHKETENKVFKDILKAANNADHNTLIYLKKKHKLYAFYLGEILRLLEEFKDLLDSKEIYDKIKNVYAIYSSFMNIECLYALKLFKDMNIPSSEQNLNSINYYVDYVFKQVVDNSVSHFHTISNDMENILKNNTDDNYELFKTLFKFGGNEKTFVYSGTLNVTKNMLLFTHKYFQVLHSYIICLPGLIEANILIEYYNPNVEIENDKIIVIKDKESLLRRVSLLEKRISFINKFLEDLHKSPSSNNNNISDPIADFFFFTNIREDHYLIIHSFMEQSIFNAIESQDGQSKKEYLSLHKSIYKELYENAGNIINNIGIATYLKESLKIILMETYNDLCKEIKEATNNLSQDGDIQTLDLSSQIRVLEEINQEYYKIIFCLDIALNYRTKIHETIIYGGNKAPELSELTNKLIINNTKAKEELELIRNYCFKMKSGLEEHHQGLYSNYKDKLLEVKKAKEEEERLRREEEERQKQAAEMEAKHLNQTNRSRIQKDEASYTKLLQPEELRTIIFQDPNNSSNYEIETNGRHPEEEEEDKSLRNQLNIPDLKNKNNLNKDYIDNSSRYYEEESLVSKNNRRHNKRHNESSIYDKNSKRKKSNNMNRKEYEREDRRESSSIYNNHYDKYNNEAQSIVNDKYNNSSHQNTSYHTVNAENDYMSDMNNSSRIQKYEQEKEISESMQKSSCVEEQSSNRMVQENSSDIDHNKYKNSNNSSNEYIIGRENESKEENQIRDQEKKLSIVEKIERKILKVFAPKFDRK